METRDIEDKIHQLRATPREAGSNLQIALGLEIDFLRTFIRSVARNTHVPRGIRTKARLIINN